MKYRIGTALLCVAAAAGVCSGLGVASGALDDVVAIEYEEGSQGPDTFWCGAQCGESWVRVFQCYEGQSCCGWLTCSTLTPYGACCPIDYHCELGSPSSDPPAWGCHRNQSNP